MQKKIINCLFFISLIFILLGTAFVLFMPQILDWLPTFLEEKIFHRTFNHDSYRETMVSLVSFPIFIAIVIDTLCFIRFSSKQKFAVLFFYLASILLTLLVASYTAANAFIDQDLSSETLFGLECFRSKTFWPTTWYYSMEFRFLNTQLLTAPLFLFTKNLALVRAITAVLCEAVLFGGTWFMLHELKIKQNWLKFLCCTLMISPVSWSYFTVVQGGSYYIPHIVFSFFYVGLFISILFHSDSHSEKKQKALCAVFLVLAFLSGVSSIRYILNFTFPVWAVIVFSKFYDFCKNREQNTLKLKAFFVDDKQVLFSTAGLFISGIGYMFNSVVIASIFTFKNMNKIRFNSLGEMTVDGIKNMLLDTAGYNGNISVFTPGGIANVLLLVIVIFTVLIFIDLYKNRLENFQKFFLQYVLFFFLFHLYTNVCTEMTGRYFTMVFVFFIPFLALTVEHASVSAVKKWLLAASSAVMILTNAYLCFGKMQTGDRSLKLDGVCKFLEQNGYEFGYAFSNIANPIWFWTNGKIEVAAIDSDDKNGIDVVPNSFSIHKWLEPKRFTQKDYYKGENPVFFVLKQEEYSASLINNTPPRIVIMQEPVFKDGTYVVFEYESPEAFISLFKK